jgi:hypothetical protein
MGKVHKPKAQNSSKSARHQSQMRRDCAGSMKMHIRLSVLIEAGTLYINIKVVEFKSNYTENVTQLIS